MVFTCSMLFIVFIVLIVCSSTNKFLRNIIVSDVFNLQLLNPSKILLRFSELNGFQANIFNQHQSRVILLIEYSTLLSNFSGWDDSISEENIFIAFKWEHDSIKFSNWSLVKLIYSSNY